ncbi:hypothetical protein ACVWY2_006252 [Bradyrhizobium sp. JR6.1]
MFTLPGLAFTILDELGDVLRRHVLVDGHHVRHAVEGSHRRDIAHEIELQIRVERGVDVVRRIDQQHGVAVRLGVDRSFGADIVAGARLVLDHELLAELLRQPLPDQARDDVGGAARRIANNPAHRSRRIVGSRSAADRECRNPRPDQAQRGAA